MIALMLVVFVIGYLMIALEHVTHINKATFALLMCGVLWAIYALCGHDPDISNDLVIALGDTCEIVVFLIGAMTIVELIDRYGGFNIIVRKSMRQTSADSCGCWHSWHSSCRASLTT